MHSKNIIFKIITFVVIVCFLWQDALPACDSSKGRDDMLSVNSGLDEDSRNNDLLRDIAERYQSEGGYGAENVLQTHRDLTPEVIVKLIEMACRDKKYGDRTIVEYLFLLLKIACREAVSRHKELLRSLLKGDAVYPLIKELAEKEIRTGIEEREVPQIGKRAEVEGIIYNVNGKPVAFKVNGREIPLTVKDINLKTELWKLKQTFPEHAGLLESIINCLNGNSPDVYEYSKTEADLFGFAKGEKEGNFIAVYKDFADDPIALFHEIGEYLIKQDVLKLKYKGKTAKFLKMMGLYEKCRKWLKAKLVLNYEGKKIIIDLRGESLSIALKNPNSPHYLLRALQRAVFGEEDKDLTKAIKLKQEEGGGVRQDLAKEKIPLCNSEKMPLDMLIGVLETIDINNVSFEELFANPIKLQKMIDAFKGNPQRLDTLIHNQAGYERQAVVELISNAIDAALIEQGIMPIGRFGIGAFQSLALLEDPSDYVSWTTSIDGAVGWQIRISKDNGEYYIQTAVTNQGVEKGTIVEVHKKGFVKQKQKYMEFVKQKFGLNTRLPIYMNGTKINPLTGVCYINGDILPHHLYPKLDVKVEINANGVRIIDKGCGMDAKTVLTKLIIPRTGNKESPKSLPSLTEVKQQTKIFYVLDRDRHPSEKNNTHISLQVAGVEIETIITTGHNLPQSLVIELPPATVLTTERGVLQIDSQVRQCIIAAVEKILSECNSDKVILLNGIGALLRVWESRGKEAEILIQDVQNIIRDWVRSQKQENGDNIIFLPTQNVLTKADAREEGPDYTDDGFFNLGHSPQQKVIYLDCILYPFNPNECHGLTKVANWHSDRGYELWIAPFKTGSERVFFLHKNYIILDSNSHEKDRDNPAAIQLLINPSRDYVPEDVTLGRLRGYFIFAPKPSLTAQQPGSEGARLAEEKPSDLEDEIYKRGMEIVQIYLSFGPENVLANIGVVTVNISMKEEIILFLRNHPEQEQNLRVLVQRLKNLCDSRFIDKSAAGKILLEAVRKYKYNELLNEAIQVTDLMDSFEHQIKAYARIASEILANAARQHDADVIFEQIIDEIESKTEDTSKKINLLSFVVTILGEIGKTQKVKQLTANILSIIKGIRKDKDIENVYIGYIERCIKALVQTGSVQEAISFSNEILEIAEKRVRSSDLRKSYYSTICGSLIKAGRFLLEKGKVHDADVLFKHADTITKSKMADTEDRVTFNYLLVGKLLEAGKLDDANTLITYNITKIEGMRKSGRNGHYLNVVYRMADIIKKLVTMGKPRDADSILARARQIAETKITDPELQVLSYIYLGGRLIETEKIKDVELLIRQAIKITQGMRKHKRIFSYQHIINMLFDSAKQLAEAKKSREADTFFMMARQIVETEFPPKDMAYIPIAERLVKDGKIEVAKTLVLPKNLVSILTKCAEDSAKEGKLQDADSLFAQAQEIIEEEIDEPSEKSLLCQSVVRALAGSASQLAKEGDSQNSDLLFAQALQITETKILKPEARVNAYISIAKRLIDAGKIPEARLILKQAIKIVKKEISDTNMQNNLLSFIANNYINCAGDLAKMEVKADFIQVDPNVNREDIKHLNAYIENNSHFFSENPIEKGKLINNFAVLPQKFCGCPILELAPILTFGSGKMLALLDKDSISQLYSRICSYSMEEMKDFFAFLNNLLDFNRFEIEEFISIAVRWADIYTQIKNDKTKDLINSLLALSETRPEYFQCNNKKKPVISDQALGMLVSYLCAQEKEMLLSEQSEIDKDLGKVQTHDDLTGLSLSKINAVFRKIPDRVRTIKNLSDYRNILNETKLSESELTTQNEQIAKTITGQDKSEHLYLRELVQNSRRAQREAGVTTPIKVRSFIRDNTNEWVVSVEDGAGMDLARILGPLLVLDETTNTNKADQSLGIFGIGFYTVFADCDTVRIETSTGNGIIYYLQIEKDAKGNLVITNLQEKKGSYKGTRIERIKKFQPGNIPFLDVIFNSDSLQRYVGAVQDAEIHYNGKKINEDLILTGKVDTPYGELRLYTTASHRQRVCLNGLYVESPKPEEYFALVPEMYRNLIFKGGFVIELPARIELTTSRKTFTKKEKTLLIIQKAVAIGCYQSIVNQFITGDVYPLGLTQDYFANKFFYIDPVVIMDAHKINSGNWSKVNFKKYVITPDDSAAEREKKITRVVGLITLIKIEYNGKRINLNKIRKAVLRRDLDDIPMQLLSGFAGGYIYMAVSLLKIKDRRFSVYSEQKVANDPKLYAFYRLCQCTLEKFGLGSKIGVQIGEGHERIKAAYYLTIDGRNIIFNMKSIGRIVEDFYRILTSGEDSYNFFLEFLDVFSHEAGHYYAKKHERESNLEGVFAWHKLKVLRSLILSGSNLDDLVEKIREEMRITPDAATDQNAEKTKGQIGKRAHLERIIGNIAYVRDEHGNIHKLKLTPEALDIDGLRQKISRMDGIDQPAKDVLFAILGQIDPKELIKFYTFGELIDDFFGFYRKSNNAIGLFKPIASNPIALFHELGHYLMNSRVLQMSLDEKNRLLISFNGRPYGKPITLTKDALKQAKERDKYVEKEKKDHYLLRALQRQMFGEDDRDLTKIIRLDQLAEKLIRDIESMEMFEGLKQEERNSLKEDIKEVLGKVAGGGEINEADLNPIILTVRMISLRDKFELVARIAKFVNSVFPRNPDKAKIVALIEGEILEQIEDKHKETDLAGEAKKQGEKKGIPPSEIDSIFNLFRDGIDILTMDPELDPGQIDGSYFSLTEQLGRLLETGRGKILGAISKQKLKGRYFKVTEGKIIPGTKLFKAARRLKIYNDIYEDTKKMLKAAPKKAKENRKEAVVVFRLDQFKHMPLVGLKAVVNNIKGGKVKLGLRIPEGIDKKRAEEFISNDWELKGTVILLSYDIFEAEKELGEDRDVVFVEDEGYVLPEGLKGTKVIGVSNNAPFHQVFLLGVIYAPLASADELEKILESKGIGYLKKGDLLVIKLERMEEILEEFKNRRIYLDIMA